MKDIGLVLPGGGARGGRQAGAIKAIEESGLFRIRIISSCSVGSLNAAGFLSGGWVFLQDLWLNIVQTSNDIYRNWRPLGMIQGLLFHTGLKNAKPLRRLINKHVDVDKIMQSDVVLLMTTCNLNTEAITYIKNEEENRTRFLDFVYASASYPAAFDIITIPVEFAGRTEYHSFSDGGIRRQVPLAVLEKYIDNNDLILDYIFVIMTGDLEAEYVDNFDLFKWPVLRKIARFFPVAMRFIHMMGREIKIAGTLPESDRDEVVFIYPSPQRVPDSLDFETGRVEGFNEGYETTKNVIEAMA